MKINDIILIIAIVVITSYIFCFLNNKTENFTAVGEVDQNFTTYLTRGYIISPGMIIMWSGSITNIPTGYVLCDGTNGTPDLRNRFVVGAGTGTKYTIGNIGGNDNITLTTNQLPAHTHTGNTASNSIGAGCSRTAGTGNFLVGNPDGKGNCGNTNHSHSFTTDSTGNGTSIDIRPSYYALAFLMKTVN